LVAGAELGCGLSGAMIAGGLGSLVGAEAGLTVSTENTAAATIERAAHTAISGTIVTGPVSGRRTLPSKRRRRWARSSRW
jgi:hypothetical protein